MKADIPLAERRRLEREQQAEIRAMLAPRHFQTMQDQMLIDAVLFQMEMEVFRQALPAIHAALGRSYPAAASVPAPVVTPEPEPVAPVAPALPMRAGAPDMPFDLRFHLGLR